jgi:hypothetical protein
MNSKERHELRYQRRKAAREARRRVRLDPYDNFTNVASISSLITANFESRRSVLWKASAARYNMHFYRNAVLSHNALMENVSIHRGFYVFDIMERGKPRHIHSLHYSERVIRRSLCTNALVPILSHNLIYDNGASLEGKGITFSINRTAAMLHRYYRTYGSNDGYVLVIDFRKYFDNIRHDKLKEIVDRYVLNSQLNTLVKSIIDTANYDKTPDEQGKGLYIGPEDSQILAIAYPNSIDHKIKDQWSVRYFNRYMDDSIIVHPSKDAVVQFRDALFVEYEKMGIIPNPKKTQIVKLSRGFTFLKTKFFLTDTGKVIMKPAHDSIVRERRKLKKFKRFHDSGEMTLKQIEQSYMSWRGFILQKNAYLSVHSMDELFYSLFGTRPWRNIKKKRRKSKHGRRKSNKNSG